MPIDGQIETAIDHILTIKDQLNRLRADESIASTSTSSTTQSTSSLTETGIINEEDSFLMHFYARLGRNPPVAAQSDGTDLRRFFRDDPPSPFNMSALNYWQVMANKDPAITELAVVVLAASASQVSVERAFSVLPLIMTDRRLAPDLIDKICMIKLNPNKN